MRGGISRGGFARDQAADIAGEGIAGARFVGVHDGIEVRECIQFPIGAQRVGLVRDIQLGGGAGGSAHGDALFAEFVNCTHAEVDLDHDALAVIEGRGPEGGAPFGITAERPGRVTAEHVNLATGQRSRALGSGKRTECDRIGVAQNSGCDSATNVNVKAFEITGIILGAEAWQYRVHAANQLTAITDTLDNVAILRGCEAGTHCEYGNYKQCNKYKTLHLYNPPC